MGHSSRGLRPGNWDSGGAIGSGSLPAYRRDSRGERSGDRGTEAWPPRTQGHEHVGQEEVPARLPRVHFDQRLPCGQEALDVAVAEGGPRAQPPAQEAPAAG